MNQERLALRIGALVLENWIMAEKIQELEKLLQPVDQPEELDESD